MDRIQEFDRGRKKIPVEQWNALARIANREIASRLGIKTDTRIGIETYDAWDIVAYGVTEQESGGSYPTPSADFYTYDQSPSGGFPSSGSVGVLPVRIRTIIGGTRTTNEVTEELAGGAVVEATTVRYYAEGVGVIVAKIGDRYHIVGSPHEVMVRVVWDASGISGATCVAGVVIRHALDSTAECQGWRYVGTITFVNPYRLDLVANNCGFCVYDPQTNSWELLAAYACCEGSSSGSSTPPSHSGSSGSHSSSGSLGSSGSIGSHGSSASASVGPSESVGSTHPSTSGGGSDKSTAIVPASWSKTGYVALFIHEMPEVRFDDVMVMTVPREGQWVSVDPRFLEVCERGTIEVCGISSDKPVVVGARVHTDRLRIAFAEQAPQYAVRLVIRLTGIRRGFAGKRFPERTREQFEANERFINSAYPSDPRSEN